MKRFDGLIRTTYSIHICTKICEKKTTKKKKKKQRKETYLIIHNQKWLAEYH